jgi:hypothetical protein
MYALTQKARHSELRMGGKKKKKKNNQQKQISATCWECVLDLRPERIRALQHGERPTRGVLDGAVASPTAQSDPLYTHAEQLLKKTLSRRTQMGFNWYGMRGGAEGGQKKCKCKITRNFQGAK